MTTTRTKFDPLKRGASPAEVLDALRDLRTLWQPNPRTMAEIRLERAKRLMTEAAAQALIDKAPNAAELADAALERHTAARAALRMIDDASSETGGESKV